MINQELDLSRNTHQYVTSVGSGYSNINKQQRHTDQISLLATGYLDFYSHVCQASILMFTSADERAWQRDFNLIINELSPENFHAISAYTFTPFSDRSVLRSSTA